MKTMVDQAKQLAGRLAAVMNEWPLARRAVLFALVLSIYSLGVFVLEALVDNRLFLVLAAVFFLPLVLRVWLELYWQVREELRGLRVRLARRRSRLH